MATSSEFARLANGAPRALADDIFDALREAVIVVDCRSAHLPVVRANAAARRCFLGENSEIPLVESSLYSLLGAETDSVMAAALGALAEGAPSVIRVLPWRFAGREIAVTTELKGLGSEPAQSIVMLTFAEPSTEPLTEVGAVAVTEALPLDLLLLDKELTVIYANDGAARAAGSAPDGLLSLSALILAPTSAVPREVLISALEGENFHDDSVAVTTPGAPTRWFEVNVQSFSDAGKVAGVAVLSMEVTERRRRQRAVASLEKHALRRSAPARAIVTVTSLEGKLRYVSGGMTTTLGYVPAERLFNSIFDIVHVEDVAELRAKFAELADGTLIAFSRQVRVRHKDGPYRWLECTCVSALDNPSVGGIVISARDITERKLAETRLAQREEVFKLAADAVNGIIFDWDLERSIVHRSRGVRDMLGMDPSELEAVGAWSSRIHPQDRAWYDAKTSAALNGGRGWTASYRIRTAHGRYRSIMERALIQRDADGEPIRAIGCAVDVSEVKRLTDLLGEAQRSAKMGGWEYSYETRELEWTDETFRIYGTERSEFALTWNSMLAQFPPESRLCLSRAIDVAEASDGNLDVEIEIMTLKNQPTWVRVVGRIEKLEGRPFRAFGSAQNIQSQKLAQIALANSTDWLKLSMGMAHMHAWRWTRTTDTLEFAIVDGQFVNLPQAFPGMQKLMSRVHPKDRLSVRRAIDHAFERHTEVHREFRLKSHDGRYRAYAAIARPLFDAANQPCGLVGVTQDVTERHESQTRLRRSEELLRTTTANTADSLLLVDQELRIQFMNRDVCGFHIDDVVGRDISILIPQSSRDTVIARLHRVLTSGDPATYEFDCTSESGETDYFENRAVLVREAGIGTGISITMRNITERKRLEQEILNVASRERQAIGQDLHDGLGQELTGVALMLRSLVTQVKKTCPESKGRVEEILSLVNQSTETARNLARGLMPVKSGGGGLAGALRLLAERDRELYGLEIDCQVTVSSEQRLSETTANHLYRIAQEALTNAARHAQASAVTVFLRVTPRKFTLRISDNGSGVGKALMEGSGMGLKIMSYRASMIGASFEIQPNDPRGTVICVAGQQTPVTGSLTSAQAI